MARRKAQEVEAAVGPSEKVHEVMWEEKREHPLLDGPLVLAERGWQSCCGWPRSFVAHGAGRGRCAAETGPSGQSFMESTRSLAEGREPIAGDSSEQTGSVGPYLRSIGRYRTYRWPR